MKVSLTELSMLSSFIFTELSHVFRSCNFHTPEARITTGRISFFFFFWYKILSGLQFMSKHSTIVAFLIEQNGIMHVFNESSFFQLNFSA